jgi:assimilatory nitrate reductase catalytic subunit
VNVLGEMPDHANLGDPESGDHRVVSLANGRLDAALFIGRERDSIALDWLIEMLPGEKLDASQRTLLLSGRPPSGGADQGPLVCSCFGVRQAVIQQAIADGARDTDAVGLAVKAGTNCGSCRPELKRLIADLAEAGIPLVQTG